MEFGYLVSMITTDAKCNMEIKRRIVIGEETFSKRKELQRSQKWATRKEDIK